MIILRADLAIKHIGYETYSKDIEFLSNELYRLYSKYYELNKNNYASSESLYNLYMNNAKMSNSKDLVIIDDNKIIGYCNMNYDDFIINDNKLLWLSDIYIWPQYRSRGLANKLINIIKHNTKEDIYLACKDDMIKFYEKKDFRLLNIKILDEWNIMKFSNNNI